jgi:hypothetical protein
MAASVVIQLTLENNGVLTGLKAVGGELDNLKTHAATGAAGAGKSLGDLDKSTQKSIDSARLLESTLGVALPRTLTKIIGQSEAFGNVLSAAFNVSVVGAMAAAVVVVGGKIAEAALEWGGYTKAMQDAYAANVKANTEQLANPRNLDIARQTLAAMNAQKNTNDQIIASKTKETEVVQDLFEIGTQGVAIASERVALEKELQKTEEARVPLLKKMEELAFQQGREISAAQAAAKAAGLQGFAAIQAATQATQNQLDALHAAGKIDQPGYEALTSANSLKGANDVNALATKNAEATRKLRDQVTQGWLDGDSQILAKEQAMYADLDDLRKHTQISEADLQARRALYHEQAEQEMTKAAMAEADKRGKAEQDALQLLRDSMDETAASSVQATGRMRGALDQLDTGLARVDAETQKALGSLEKRFDAAAGTLTGDQMTNALDRLTEAEVAIIKKGEAEKEQIQREYLQRQQAAINETLQMQEAAAVAIAPPWERADMEIYTSAAQRIREIGLQERSGLISSADAAARTAAVWQESAGKVLDSWTSTFETLFSGGGAQYIQDLARKFMARIAAELTLQSGLGGILGPMLGLPSGVQGVTNAGFGTTFGGGTNSLLGALGLAGGSIGGAATGAAGFGGSTSSLLATLGLGGGSTGTGATGASGAAGGYDVNAVNQLLGIPALSGVPALSGAGLAGGGGKGLFSIAGLGSMLPIGAGYLGSTLGGTPGAIGGGLLGALGATSLGVSSIGGPMLSLWTHLAGIFGPSVATGLLAGAGGGLLGFGVGQKYGTAAGAITGAASGAAMGALFTALVAGGGPIGAIIGGIIGLLGGIFGGMFGGSARRKAADTFVQQQETAADQIEAQFKSYQVDYPTALTDLEQIRTNAEEQLRKLKDEGKKAYSRTLSPYIDKIEGELKGYEDERERRETLAFAPPQFASGGYVSGRLAGWRSDGGIQAIVHPGEYVVNPAATARNRAALENMNSGGGSSVGDLHVHGPLIQANRLDEAWLRNGGAVQITQAIRRARLEGKSAI